MPCRAADLFGELLAVGGLASCRGRDAADAVASGQHHLAGVLLERVHHALDRGVVERAGTVDTVAEPRDDRLS